MRRGDDGGHHVDGRVPAAGRAWRGAAHVCPQRLWGQEATAGHTSRIRPSVLSALWLGAGDGFRLHHMDACEPRRERAAMMHLPTRHGAFEAPVPARESTSLVGPPADRRDSPPLRNRGPLVGLWHALRLDSPPMLAPMPRPLTDRQRWQEEL